MIQTETSGRRRGVAVQARGERRRRQILEATLRVIAREGVAGVTHRAVASEAGVPLASTTYYFKSKGELLEETFRLHVARGAAGSEAGAIGTELLGNTIDETATRLAAVLAEGIAKRPGDVVAEYELYLEASRRPAMRELSQAWHKQVAEQFQQVLAHVGSTSPVEDTYLVIMALTGMEIDAVTRGEHGLDPEQMRFHLARLLGALLKSPARGG